MAGVNKVILLGNVGKDPEVRTVGSGMVAGITLATSESYKDKEGKKVETTEWHNLVIWGKLAEIVQKYIKKGDKIYVEGKIVTEKWTDKDGNNRFTTKIKVTELTMLSGGAQKSEGNAPQEAQVIEDSEEGGDGLPF